MNPKSTHLMLIVCLHIAAVGLVNGGYLDHLSTQQSQPDYDRVPSEQPFRRTSRFRPSRRHSSVDYQRRQQAEEYHPAPVQMVQPQYDEQQEQYAPFSQMPVYTGRMETQRPYEMPHYVPPNLNQGGLNDGNPRAESISYEDEDEEGRKRTHMYTRSRSNDEDGSFDAGHVSTQTQAISQGHFDPSKRAYISGSMGKIQAKDYSQVQEGDKNGAFHFHSLSTAEINDKELTKDYMRTKRKKKVSQKGYSLSNTETKVKTTLNRKNHKTMSQVEAHSDGSDGGYISGRLAFETGAYANTDIGANGDISTVARGRHGATSTKYTPKQMS